MNTLLDPTFRLVGALLTKFNLFIKEVTPGLLYLCLTDSYEAQK